MTALRCGRLCLNFFSGKGAALLSAETILLKADALVFDLKVLLLDVADSMTISEIEQAYTRAARWAERSAKR